MRWHVTVAASLALAVALACGETAVADPPPVPREAAARVVSTNVISASQTNIFVESPAMQRVVQIQILHPAGGGPRPSYYLLDGVDSENDNSDWLQKTDAAQFFANKNVNVVMPVGGKASYYTDWQKPDPVLGINMWETFLTRELPPIIDGQFDGNGVNAIGGLSMGGQAALILAARNPELYRAISAFSACPDTGREEAKQLVRVTVASRGGDATNMWGPDSDPDWREHDPGTLAENLRGKAMYISVGNGVLGPPDFVLGNDFGTLLSTGAPLEIGANMCTSDFQTRLDSLSIPAQFVYRFYGTHSWPYWQGDLHDSWPTLAAALGTA
ncbi:alpha/beta hydrolase family protein [Antrihabitans sp. YC2-6]|uniref:alpha/beta hydrolase n=1 Tax=Antrihabitans sp. YC2-6 TaxID=2799498 RepID=UPI0018F570EE|nr:alpha/beta hydrolase family protein [Antrihabitans sp. YC2-6]MBJ8346182.1 esterase family protein [Antrihabitans sp. YC2-6]